MSVPGAIATETTRVSTWNRLRLSLWERLGEGAQHSNGIEELDQIELVTAVIVENYG